MLRNARASCGLTPTDGDGFAFAILAVCDRMREYNKRRTNLAFVYHSLRPFFSFAFCCLLCGSLLAQPQMLPGQLPRQSLSGGLLFRCLFDKASNAETGSDWPDYWTRKEGIDNGIPFPRHLAIGIAENPNPFGNYVLRMRMEGGAAAVFSPKIPIRPGMGYTVSAYVETDSLVFNEVSICAAFYGNDTTKPIRTVESKKVGNADGWQHISIGPIMADMPNVKSIAVGLLVMPTARQDFGTQVNFTNVEIWESPNVSLEMANDNHLFFSPRDLDVRCQFRGLDPAQHSVVFMLEDPWGNIIRERETDFMIGNSPAARFVITTQNANDVIHGTATWKNMPVVSAGFYRIRVATPESYIQSLRLPADQTFDDPLIHTEPLTFVVMPQGFYQPGGEFGWTLDGWSPDEITKALPILAQSGLSHLKLPLWISEKTPPQQQESLLHLCSSLSAHQVRLIGLLSPAPTDMVAKISRRQVNAFSIMENNTEPWGESMQPALRALSLLVKDWQWTSDTDQSLIDMFFDSTGNMSSANRRRFLDYQKAFDKEQFGFGIGMAWNWHQNVPDEQFAIPNFFLNFPVDASISSEEAVAALTEMSALPFRKSVSIAPLPVDNYTLDARITNFVQSLVLLKAAGMDTISLTAPKDEQTGILRNDGTPNELYLPWRTTAMQLSGSRLLGSITLPNRSRNYCFDKGGGKCMMVVWHDDAASDKPVLETLYLGREPDMIDIWGKQTVLVQMGNNHTVPVTQTPRFITGLDINAAKFRLSMQTANRAIPSIPNQTHTIPFSYKNESAFPVSIQMTPEGPQKGGKEDWTITPPTHTVNLESGRNGSGAFDLTLLSRADTGLRLFQYNVKISGTDAAEFAVYDEMQVGDPDVYMEFVSRLNEKGDLEVIQVFINNSEQTYTYDCRLIIQTRAPQKFQVRRQGFGRTEHVYTIPRGKALLDSGVTEITLRATPASNGAGILGDPMVYTIPLVSE